MGGRGGGVVGEVSHWQKYHGSSVAMDEIVYMQKKSDKNAKYHPWPKKIVFYYCLRNI